MRKKRSSLGGVPHVLACMWEVLAFLVAALFECLAVDEILVRLRLEALILVKRLVVYVLAQFPRSRRGLFGREDNVRWVNASKFTFIFLWNFTRVIGTYYSQSRLLDSLFHFALFAHTLDRLRQCVRSTLLLSWLGQVSFFTRLLILVAFPCRAISIVQVTQTSIGGEMSQDSALGEPLDLGGNAGVLRVQLLALAAVRGALWSVGVASELTAFAVDLHVGGLLLVPLALLLLSQTARVRAGVLVGRLQACRWKILHIPVVLDLVYDVKDRPFLRSWLCRAWTSFLSNDARFFWSLRVVSLVNCSLQHGGALPVLILL